MKVIVALCLLAVALAAPPPPLYTSGDKETGLLRFENENIGSGAYKYAYEQTDGQAQEQEGQLVNEGREDEHIVIKGRFSFVIDGVTYIVTYVADQNGYQPEIEQGPGGAVPDAVVASLLG